MFTAHHQAVANGLHTDIAAFLAVLNTLLHVFTHLTHCVHFPFSLYVSGTVSGEQPAYRIENERGLNGSCNAGPS